MKCDICGSKRFGSFRSRPLARCLNCNSLERHREVFPFLVRLIASEQVKSILHFAPEPCLAKYLRERTKYVAADLSPKHKNIQRANLLNLPYKDKEFDATLCIHVLEHIVDINKAIQELRRVSTYSIIMVPTRHGPTYRNPEATTPKQKEIYHGQNNHEWWLGSDFQDRLTSNGFHVSVFGNIFFSKAEE